MLIDHSKPKVEWRPSSGEERRLLRQILRAHHDPAFRGLLYCLDRLYEGTSTRNHRAIGCFGPAYFVRVHVGLLDASEIERCQKVAEFVHASGIFDCEYTSALISVASRWGQRTLPLNADYPDPPDPLRPNRQLPKVQFAEVFPYLHGLSHFDGRRPDQLRSYAGKLGRLQKALSESGLEPIGAAAVDDVYVETIDRLWADYELLEMAVARAEPTNDFAIELWMSNRAKVKDALSSIRDRLARWDDPSKLLLLNDPHPHNCLFDGDACVLLYDFARVGLFRHSEVLAYAAHRFVREVIVAAELAGEKNPPGNIPRLLDQFLEEYSRHGPPVHSGFRAVLPDLIRLSSLRKLTSIMRELVLVLVPEGEHRPTEQLQLEGLKFAGFLNEAEAFGPAR